MNVQGLRSETLPQSYWVGDSDGVKALVKCSVRSRSPALGLAAGNRWFKVQRPAPCFPAETAGAEPPVLTGEVPSVLAAQIALG